MPPAAEPPSAALASSSDKAKATSPSISPVKQSKKAKPDTGTPFVGGGKMDFEEPNHDADNQRPIPEACKSFRDAVTSKDSSSTYLEDWLQPLSEEEANMPLDVDTEDPDCPVIECSRGEHRLASSRLKDAVIFHVLGRRVPFMIMNNRIQNLWAVRGQVRITDMGAGFFTARFDSSEDYRRALMEGPWKIGEHYIVPRLWQEGFDPCTDTLSHTLVWVRLPGLPLEFFTETFLRRIGDKIGQLVRIDPTTLAMERGNYARICLHVVCFKCGIYGHTNDICPSATATADLEGEQVHSNPLFLEEVMAKERPEVFEEYGPWMLAKSRSKRNSGVPHKPAGRTMPSAVEHAVTPPVSSVAPQGSRFIVLADESPHKDQVPPRPPVGKGTSSSSVADPNLGKQNAPKKSKAKKDVGSTPVVEASSTKLTGKRASKTTTTKTAAASNMKGKGASQKVLPLKLDKPPLSQLQLWLLI
ncbi:hypothetical protein LINPERHAP1_LOCUS7200 [Linum perenne]